MKNSTRLVLNYFSFLINTQGKKESEITKNSNIIIYLQLVKY